MKKTAEETLEKYLQEKVIVDGIILSTPTESILWAMKEHAQQYHLSKLEESMNELPTYSECGNIEAYATVIREKLPLYLANKDKQGKEDAIAFAIWCNDNFLDNGKREQYKLWQSTIDGKIYTTSELYTKWENNNNAKACGEKYRKGIDANEAN